MKYSYVARQPILDTGKKTIGYELLFRDGPKNTFPEVEPELATSRLLSDHFLSTHYNTLGDKLGFVNFPYASLINLVPTLFPKESLVVEVLEDCEPTDELLEAIKAIFDAGYTIALDDFVPSKAWKRFLPYISIIKFDIRLTPIVKAAMFMNSLKGLDIKFLAEKVETYEEYQEAKKAGFTYFQGYFFSKPEMIQTRALNPAFLTTVQLLKEIAHDPIDFGEVERLITLDVTMSYKLLTYVNSAGGSPTTIRSFRQALIYLGEQKLRKFVSLVAIASAKEDKPDSLYGLAVIRARQCELLVEKMNVKVEPGQAFLTGMFSLLDSLFDQPLKQVLDSVPIDVEIKQALIQRKGVLGAVLAMVVAYEQARWDEATRIRQLLKLSEAQLGQAYDEATTWAQELLSPALK
ncbi:EAL domain-containing protein [Vibrio sp. 10N.261.46.E12]|uniref:EAL and HDOD domain-containing protein n=1 Tax=unclassified Vibrio TaxID=2614977 RepID=UPI000977C056|nr:MULTISPECIES: EAL domain-containing protein [unclassified Vibrio]OMO35648.1 histidine kinase [Vibrio sp. 10N.261.45.E1]PMJ27431.1 histidine kinase [Vibrio sp. 10N.286.45.B6]PML89856.1 histidine kinase [Vibrio sp. 10N.261.49.E11]PMM64694.1 histidine kinase [Vibrio sp. 10N.261.46.F12]PMM84492.1 histidine kinase [Vibrio sp. 10N.261.46.E8]